ncbi:MAG TPA: hypothetical protein DCQ06_07420 [Myxococcales bacterium]|nr:hypothetical protein [Myxococcales bacterium]
MESADLALRTPAQNSQGFIAPKRRDERHACDLLVVRSQGRISVDALPREDRQRHDEVWPQSLNSGLWDAWGLWRGRLIGWNWQERQALRRDKGAAIDDVARPTPTKLPDLRGHNACILLGMIRKPSGSG